MANLFKLTGMLAVAALAGVFLSGGTFAFLNSTVALNSATIKSGNTGLTATGSPLSLTGLYPGGSVSAAFTITNNSNTGTDVASDLPLALNVSAFSPPTADAATLSASVKVRVDVFAAGTPCPATPTGTAPWSANLTDAAFAPPTTPVPLGFTLAKGASAVVCLSASLPVTAAAGLVNKSTNSFTVTIGGVQP